MGVATIFSTTGLYRPSVLVKRIRRLSRDWERERERRLTSARFFANLRFYSYEREMPGKLGRRHHVTMILCLDRWLLQNSSIFAPLNVTRNFSDVLEK